jgi:3-oxoacyl-[acyl-carrier protein] reductase
MAGQPQAAIALLRTAEQGAFTPDQLSQLNAVQCLLQLAVANIQPDEDPLIDLTPRERQIALLLRQGASNKQLAQELNVGLPTIKTQLINLFRKTHASRRTEWVTGGVQGIGRAIVEALALRGARVVIADLQLPAAQELANELLERACQVEAVSVDLAESTAVFNRVQALEERMGRLDILLHNAGYFPLTPVAEITPATLERTLAVNLSAVFWLTQTALPMFHRQGRGCVLVTSSVTGPRVAYPGLSHYAASKVGVNGFIRNAALELAGVNVRVNGVEPGMIATPAMGNLGDDQLNDTIASRVPLGRLGKPADIAGAMLFLASDLAAYITGQTLVVDGGSNLPEV